MTAAFETRNDKCSHGALLTEGCEDCGAVPQSASTIVATTPPDLTEQAHRIALNWQLDNELYGVEERHTSNLAERIASFAAEAATQGQAISETLREALRDAAIEAHVGFNHPRQWADCDLAVCSERKGLIGDCNE